MEFATVLLIIALVLGFYTAWNIGANDVANAMGTSVGSGALTLAKAVMIAAVLEFAGAFFLGKGVSETLSRGIVDPIHYSNPLTVVYGMFSVLLAAGIWMQIASYFGWPVSTTHTIVGSLIGFGLITKGPSVVNWGGVGMIFSSWVISPILGGVLAYSLFCFLRNKILFSKTPIAQAKKYTPWITFFMIFIFAMIFTTKSIKGLDLSFSILISVASAVLIAFLCKFVVNRIKVDKSDEDISFTYTPNMVYSIDKVTKHLRRLTLTATGDAQKDAYAMLQNAEKLSKEAHQETEIHLGRNEIRSVEKIFCFLQIISACLMAFAHGTNDIANAVGPLSTAIHVIRTGSVSIPSVTPTWVLALGGVGLIVGVTTWGWRVIATIGKKITELTPTRGFAAELAAAITIVFASIFKLPVSTTHTLIGAVLGIGLAKGIYAINLSTIRQILISWVITVPAGMLLTMLFMSIINWLT